MERSVFKLVKIIILKKHLILILKLNNVINIQKCFDSIFEYLKIAFQYKNRTGQIYR
jgi:hypothetical protein